MYNILPKNKCNIRNSFCYLLSLLLICWCLPYKCPAVKSQYLGSICHCIFFPFGIYHDGTFHYVRHGRLPYFPGKNPIGITGNGVAMTCCTPRHRMGKVAPLYFLHNFLIFYFPESCCIHCHIHPRLLYWQHSIYFWSLGLEKVVLLQDQWKCLLLFGLTFVWKFLH